MLFLPTLNSLHPVLELSRDFSPTPLVPVAGCPQCVGILATAEPPRVVLQLCDL